ncbi:MAG TPA: hypothetical protein VJ020_09235 [Anaerolineales bacterium]|nr:hypothetical protein [Anaerolineales bacterium]
MPLTLPSKIQFDLSALNSDGLAGPPDGLRAVGYEFCIPATLLAEAEVKAIDPTAEVYKEASGRAGCAESQYLVIGSTQQANFREVLLKLASLDYVERIIQSDAE